MTSSSIITHTQHWWQICTHARTLKTVTGLFWMLKLNISFVKYMFSSYTSSSLLIRYMNYIHIFVSFFFLAFFFSTIIWFISCLHNSLTDHFLNHTTALDMKISQQCNTIVYFWTKVLCENLPVVAFKDAQTSDTWSIIGDLSGNNFQYLCSW